MKRLGTPFFRNRGLRRLIAMGSLALLIILAGWKLTEVKDHQDWTAEEKAELVRSISDWIRAERDRQRPEALPLHPSEMEMFGPYFPKEVLEIARVRAVDDMPSPPIAEKIRHQGRKIFQLSAAQGLALDDTIILRGASVPPGSPQRRSVLFHELVHVTQYRQLGVDAFMQQYFASLEATGYRYPDILFEFQAFELQHRFVTSLGRPFSVEDELLALSDRSK